MATRKIKDIITDMRTDASDCGQDFATLAEKTNERAAELEAILTKAKADDRFVFIMSLLALLFVGAFSIITYMNNDDLREDVTQKKDIITEYQKAVIHDTLRTYVDENGNELTVSSLLDDNIRLMNMINDLEVKISLYESKLEYIKNRYGIRMDRGRIESSEVDSAMLLLPVYRDRISYDSIKKQWSVIRKYVKVGDKTYPE